MVDSKVDTHLILYEFLVFDVELVEERSPGFGAIYLSSHSSDRAVPASVVLAYFVDSAPGIENLAICLDVNSMCRRAGDTTHREIIWPSLICFIQKLVPLRLISQQVRQLRYSDTHITYLRKHVA